MIKLLVFLLSLKLYAIDLPVEGEVRKRVDFWKRVYTEINTNEAYLHHPDEPYLVYSKMSLPQSARDRKKKIDAEKNKIKKTLRSIANKNFKNLTKEEQKLFELIGKRSKSEVYHMSNQIRAQYGLRDRYYEGLIRSYRYMDFIKKTFKQYGIPQEGVYLPHVESSFNYNAYSKVGAAGMWQFMRSTAKMYNLQINYIIDERRDPYKSTIAAARLLKDNYRQLQSWPLAFTAYNHGARSMKLAKSTLGTDDMNEIISKYKGRRFGFASKNFYATFMATVEISKNPRFYFPDFKKPEAFTYSTIKLDRSYTMAQVLKTLNLSEYIIKDYNPVIRPSVYRSPLYLPKGFELKLPKVSQNKLNEYANRLKEIEFTKKELRLAKVHTISRGESLYYLSQIYGVSLANLIEFNQISNPSRIYPGMKIKIPSTEDQLQVKVTSKGKSELKESKVQRKTSMLRPEKLNEPAPIMQDFEKFQIILAKIFKSLRDEFQKRDNYVAHQDLKSEVNIESYNLEAKLLGENIYQLTIETDETLGHFADWANIKTQEIRTLNKLGLSSFIHLGQKLKVKIRDIEAFTAKRLEYHISIQEDFYASYKVIDFYDYKVKKGDTLAKIMINNSLPYWLLRKTQPDNKLSFVLHVGQKVRLPKLEGDETTEEAISR